MKKMIRCISLVLIVSILCVVPVFAEEDATPYASNFFNATETYLYVIDGNRIGVWFEVVARHDMDELGVSSIIMQKSSDGITWRSIKTFSPSSYPVMISEDHTYYANGVPYTGTYNYYYRAQVQFYAKDSSGSGYYTAYTSPLFLAV